MRELFEREALSLKEAHENLAKV